MDLCCDREDKVLDLWVSKVEDISCGSVEIMME